MSNNFKFKYSDNEYNSLRTEMIERISSIYTISNLAITTVISAWTAGLALLIFLLSKDATIDAYYITFAGFIDSLFFLAPILFFLPIVTKNSENLNQIASLSAYIRVFYEYIRPKYKNGDIDRYSWEYSNNLVSNINVDRGKKSISLKLYNEEYTLLSILSFLMYLATAIINIKKAFDSNLTPYLHLIIVALYSSLILIAFIFIIKIHKTSSIKNFMKKGIFYTERYINRAIELKLIPENQFQKVYNDLDPEKEQQIFHTIKKDKPSKKKK